MSKVSVTVGARLFTWKGGIGIGLETLKNDCTPRKPGEILEFCDF